MSAIAALHLAREWGVQVHLDGPNLVLDAECEPPAEVLDALRREKTEIVALLTGHQHDWSADNWRAYFDERAAIREHDGGVTKTAAERGAYEDTVAEWRNRNCDISEPGRCAWCGKAEGHGPAIIPFGTALTGHCWLHAECWSSWYEDRHERAKQALATMGIVAPSS